MRPKSDTLLSLARETVVDEATILLTRDRRAYAEALLAFSNPQPHLPGVTALVGRRHLSQRISLIAEEEVMSRGRMLVSFAIALIVAAATTSAISAFPITGDTQSTRVYKPGEDTGVTLPSVVHEVKPDYTQEALQKGIQGSVFMEIVVLASGDVGDAQVSTSLDAEYGLDQQAILAVNSGDSVPEPRMGSRWPCR